MAHIRKLEEQELIKALRLSEYAFQYEVSESEKEERLERLKRHEIWGEFTEEQLMSKIHILSLEVSINEKFYSMGGVAGVATWPEHRRKGSVSRLLKKSLLSMKEKGQMVSFLHPFDIDFYRRFGWEITASMKKYNFEAKNLFIYQDINGTVERIYKDDNLDPVKKIYEYYFKRYNGLLKREDYWWTQAIFTKGFQAGVYYDENKNPKGYVLYKMKDQLLDVQEMVYMDELARRGLWNFISQHDSMANKVKMILPIDDQQPFLLKQPKIEQEIFPYFMGRIVDVNPFLEQYELNKTDEPLTLHIKDSFAEWNNGTFVVSEGKVEYSENADKQQGLQMDIQTLMAALIGYQTADFLYDCRKISGSKEEFQKFKEGIPTRPASFYDFF
ncbi:GNAT family N-acetyltransferase [Pseudalkalibacillus caeni]|uniref:GNAT family N-acetyltransferase n=1 Tax=Exobacillus caeni TaxID=2574798 RepID=A0A5R9F1P2_9BACL|nr:GNAT family N-acetyltransferase [Pseudalkalibacillus caeni]TLS36951.1 GNAT family N-acetyltransferase [Pseudalkalibacillus caeni]